MRRGVERRDGLAFKAGTQFWVAATWRGLFHLDAVDDAKGYVRMVSRFDFDILPRRGPHDRPDCPCGHAPRTNGECAGCNCADELPAPPRRLTARQRDMLYHQLSDDHWSTPQRLGGTDGSHHSATLAQLVRKGLAERAERGGYARNAWMYRRTPAGRMAVDNVNTNS